MSTSLALYGNVAIPRAICPQCGDMSLIVGGLTACFSVSVKEHPEVFQRMSIPPDFRVLPTKQEQKHLLAEFEHRCAYCERRFGSKVFIDGKTRLIRLTWDHFIPYSFCQDNSFHNFLPACNFCNGWKSAKYFETLGEARLYLHLRWDEKLPKIEPRAF